MNSLPNFWQRPTKTTLIKNTANVRMEIVMRAVSADGNSISFPLASSFSLSLPPPKMSKIPRFSLGRSGSPLDGQSLSSRSSDGKEQLELLYGINCKH